MSRSDFLDALEADFGVRPLLYCQGGGGKDYINEACPSLTNQKLACNVVDMPLHPNEVEQLSCSQGTLLINLQ